MNIGNIDSDDAKICLLILGMHRSGTSALTRVLNLLGCALPRDLVKPIENDNDLGFWEPQGVIDINARILELAGSSWIDWLPFDTDWYHAPDHLLLFEQAQEMLAKQYGGSNFFVLKDPRICRLTKFWFDLLQASNVSPRIILPIRHPDEVAASLNTRHGFDSEFSYLLWLRHVLDAEAGSRGRVRCFTSYHELMTDWPATVARVSKAFGISWPRSPDQASQGIDAFLSDRYRHHRYDDAQFIGDSSKAHWLRTAYRIFEGWASQGENAADYDELDAIKRELDAASGAFGGLIKRGRLAGNRAKQLEAESQEKEMELMTQSEELKMARTEAEAALARQAALSEEALTSAEQQIGATLLRFEEGFSKQLAEALAQVSSTKSFATALEERVDRAEGMLASSRREADEAVQRVENELSRRNEDLADALSQLGSAKSARAALEQQVERAEARLALSKSEADTIVQRLEAELSERAEELAEVIAHLAEAKHAATMLSEQVERAESAAASSKADAERADQRFEAELAMRDKELAELRSSLAQTQSALEQRRAETHDVGQKLTDALARMDELTAQVDESEKSLQDRDADLSAATERAEAAFAEIVLLTQMLQKGEAELQALIDKRDSERQEAMQRVAALEDSERAARDHAAWQVAQLEHSLKSERENAHRAQAEMHADMVGLTDRINELVELGRTQSRLEDDLSAALARANEEQSRVEYELARAVDHRVRLEHELADLSTAYHRREDELGGSVARLTNENSHLLRETLSLGQALARSEGDKRGLQNTLSLQGKNLARTEGRVAWLAKLVAMLIEERGKKLRFTSWLPAAIGRDRLNSKLKSQGLFDQTVYLNLNRDVAEAGMDPLRHYVLHGMNEGRPSGPLASEAGNN
ncbi:hypothetical protein [Sphingobium sp. Z007]|uniref:hypothetical protein n=1 Tax=Sphingobium sp. Z007 TaxID=627495 RepID=UPI000B4A3DEE|nr:hypothetical protein [Sphingobium sp. Z007]